jgi:hypothetical protein
MTVGIDGGFVRAAHKEGFFEVIAGKSVVDFRRSDEEAASLSKCFSFVQTFDKKPTPPAMGAAEISGHAGKPAGGLSLRWR